MRKKIKCQNCKTPESRGTVIVTLINGEEYELYCIDCLSDVIIDMAMNAEQITFAWTGAHQLEVR